MSSFKNIKMTFLKQNCEKRFNKLTQDGTIDNVFPEVKACSGIEQPKFHHLDVRDHMLLTVTNTDQTAPLYNLSNDKRFVLRMAALLHDCGKLETAEFNDTRQRVMFKSHDKVGAEIAEKACMRVGMSKEQTEQVRILVKMHMRAHHMSTMLNNKLSGKATRRFLKNVGNTLPMLLALAQADGMAACGPLKPEGSDANSIPNLYKYLINFK